MGSGGWKRIALGGNKERFVRKKGFWFVKMDALDSNKKRFVQKKVFLHIKRRFLRTVKSCSNERCFGCEKERLLRAKHKAFCKWKTFG